MLENTLFVSVNIDSKVNPRINITVLLPCLIILKFFEMLLVLLMLVSMKALKLNHM